MIQLRWCYNLCSLGWDHFYKSAKLVVSLASPITKERCPLSLKNSLLYRWLLQSMMLQLKLLKCLQRQAVCLLHHRRQLLPFPWRREELAWAATSSGLAPPLIHSQKSLCQYISQSWILSKLMTSWIAFIKLVCLEIVNEWNTAAETEWVFWCNAWNRRIELCAYLMSYDVIIMYRASINGRFKWNYSQNYILCEKLFCEEMIMSVMRAENHKAAFSQLFGQEMNLGHIKLSTLSTYGNTSNC